jgi:hypothetical protein
MLLCWMALMMLICWTKTYILYRIQALLILSKEVKRLA